MGASAGAVALGGLVGCKNTVDGSSQQSSSGDSNPLSEISEPPEKYWAWVSKEVNGKVCWGCISEQGKFVVEPKIVEGEHVAVPTGYLGEKSAAGYIDNFQSNGLAGVCMPDPERGEFYTREGCVDINGDLVIAQHYSFIDTFASNGLARVQEVDTPDSLYRRGYIDASGKKRIESLYTWAESFTDNGFAMVCDPTIDSRGYLGESGQWLIEPQYDRTASFFEQTYPEIAGSWWALAGQNNWYGYLDEQENRVLTFDSRVSQVSDLYFIETTGNSWSSNRYNYPDENGLITVSCGSGAGSFGEWGFAGLDGKLAIDPIYDYALPFFEGFAAVSTKNNSNWGMIDSSGSYVIEPRFEYLDRFHNGLALARDTGSKLYGFLNMSGSWAVEPKFDRLDLFDEDGFAVATELLTNTSRGYQAEVLIDKTGTYSMPLDYLSIKKPNEKGYRFAGIFPSSEFPSGAYVLIDSGGNRVSDETYAKVGSWAKNGLCAVSVWLNGAERPLWGFVNLSGDMAIEPQFLEAKAFFEAPR
jgi:hypothetical protein